ncbi:sodium/potassium/calcium exchanger 4-like isoform X1 [Varroa jacobsoni]|uniref:sodium/potassium/calcium exchanger 4-like isoform X1 n=2 Tax=Varroa jacobsoni TaxID=62625 RepID=UPI000BFA0DA0|nr:sodium/potassium/calcium exchanger 4-like isoform X1 [Varroa jacobsoni]
MTSIRPLLDTDVTMDPLVPTNCTFSSINDFPPDLFTQEQRATGAIAIHISVILYMCGVMGIVCNRYFIPSLEIASDACGLSSDVAGATFMAIGTSAPELFSSVIGSFITEGDIGVGTIVGSAVFNILGVTAVIGLAVGKKDLKIDWFPISRDSVVYIMSVTLLIIIISDNFVSWYEAVILLLFYGLYVAIMLFNTRLDKVAHYGIAYLSKKVKSTEYTALLEETTVAQCNDDDNRKLPSPIFEVPNGGFFAIISWLIFLPANIVLTCTIPDVRGQLRCLYPLTFLISVLWIGLSSYITVWMVTVGGYTLGVPDTISGLTILATGTSVPELFATVLVARSGKGNMALCSLLGSNIFDLLFCLGAPWLAKTVIANREILIQSLALTYTSITLLATIALLYSAMVIMKWKVNYLTGVLCLALYVIFITLACLYEFLMFGFSIPC